MDARPRLLALEFPVDGANMECQLFSANIYIISLAANAG